MYVLPLNGRPSFASIKTTGKTRVFHIFIYFVFDIAVTVSFRLFTVEAWVQFWMTSYAIHDGRIDTKAKFSASFFGFPAYSNSTKASS
jgi:hypothetical protein